MNALILAGAVARGAFEVGALGELAKERVGFRRVVATSAGSLNAAVFGAGIALGRAGHAAKVLEDLWLDHGAWRDFAHVSSNAWLHLRGLFDTSKVEELVRLGLERVVGDASPADVAADVDVTFITTILQGREERAADGARRIVHEAPESFDAEALVTRARWPEVAKAAAASAAFPGMFAPPIVRGTARVDGGAVNNAPISYALDDPSVDTIFVVSSQAIDPHVPAEPGGATLIGHLADVLINERLSRDLLMARKTNERLAGVLAAMKANGVASEAERAVLDALGWRHIDLVEIQPKDPLEGTAFSGFFDRDLRARMIDLGRVAANGRAASRARAQASASCSTTRETSP